VEHNKPKRTHALPESGPGMLLRRRKRHGTSARDCSGKQNQVSTCTLCFLPNPGPGRLRGDDDFAGVFASVVSLAVTSFSDCIFWKVTIFSMPEKGRDTRELALQFLTGVSQWTPQCQTYQCALNNIYIYIYIYIYECGPSLGLRVKKYQ